MDRVDSFADKLAHWKRHGLGVMRSGAHNSTRTTPAVHERTGEQVGNHTEHWDGRIDATATRFDIAVNPNLTLKGAVDG